jgi:Concanavalin A-like lectin/glucanases superfamily/Pectate lyase superfamily protein
MKLQLLTTSGPRDVPVELGPQVLNAYDFGARPGSSDTDQTGATDIGAAIQAAIDSLPISPINSNNPGTVYVPPGSWVQSTPVLVSSGQNILGAGPLVSRITVGLGNNSSPIPTCFSGPLFVVAPRGHFSSAYGAALIGSGRSLTVDASTLVLLHDAKVWRTLNGRSALSVQLWIKPTSAGVPGVIISSTGAPDGNLSSGLQHSVIQIATQDAGGGTCALYWSLTTTSGTVTGHSATNMAYGTTHNIEFNYDGTHIDVFQDGVSVAHSPQIGTLVQKPWEGVTIGLGCITGPESDFELQTSPCQLDSIRLSSVARHTGTGSFTPPVDRYTWDASSLALYNWDQGDPSEKPWIIGQVQNNGGGSEPMLHYMRCYPITFVGGIIQTSARIQNLELNGNDHIVSGVINYNLSQCTFSDLYIKDMGKWGLAQLNGGCFFGKANNIVVGAEDVATWLQGGAYDNIQAGGQIGYLLGTGTYTACTTLDVPSVVAPYIVNSNGDIFGSVIMTSCGNDNESTAPNMMAGMIINGSVAQLKAIGCTFLAANSTFATDVPAVLCNGLPYSTDFDSCKFFVPNSGVSPELIRKGAYGTFSGSKVNVTNIQNTQGFPYSNEPLFVTTPTLQDLP